MFRKNARTNKRLVRAAIVGIVGIALVAVSACSDSSTSPTPEESANDVPAAADADAEAPDNEPAKMFDLTLRLDFDPWGAHAPFFMAKEKGFYADEGINITLGNGKGSSVTAQSVASGGDQLGHATIPAILNAIDKGSPAKIAAIMTNRTSWGALVDASTAAESLEELYDKTVMVAPSAPDKYITEAAFDINGLDASRVQFQDTDLAATFGLYAGGRADALVTTATQGIPAVDADRPSKVLAFADFGVNFADYGIIASGDMLSEPDIVNAFVTATQRGWEAAVADPRAAAEAIHKNWEQAPVDVLEGQWKLHILNQGPADKQEVDPLCSTLDVMGDSLDLLNKYAQLKADSSDVDDFYDVDRLLCE